MLSERWRRLVVLLAAVATAALTARLGVWQLDRAAQKTALQQRVEERALLPPLDAGTLATTPASAWQQHHRRVVLQGRWARAYTVFLDNRQLHGRPGFYVLTPLRLADGSAVLVQRGWLPRDPQDRTRLPPLVAEPGEVTVVGRIAPPPARLYEFDKVADGPIRQNLELADFAAETGLSLRPLSVLQLDPPGASDDGLRRDWPPFTVDVHKHYGYAFQWFALCALVTGLYVWFQFVQPRRRR